MKIMLLQARNAGDPMLDHELECFCERCELPTEAFETHNFATTSIVDRGALERVDAVMVGGSGDYSLVTGGFEWHGELLDVMRAVVAKRMPMFASCFGFQALVQAFGGTIVKDPAWAEVGTFDIRATPAAASNRLFEDAPEVFAAQLGHNDSATADLPAELTCLAYSERAPVQAVEVKDAPVIATQFHPELSMDANVVRYLRYLEGYNPELTPAEAQVEASRIHRPSPFANQMLRRFIDLYVDEGRRS